MKKTKWMAQKTNSRAWVKPLTLSVVLAFGGVNAAYAATDFAPIPLHLKNGAEGARTITPTEKPNILLVVDDSNSMSSAIGQLKTSVANLLSESNPNKYYEKVNFNVLPLNNDALWRDVASTIKNNQSFTISAADAIRKVNNLNVQSGSTSALVSHYYDATTILRYFRDKEGRAGDVCKKDYVVLLSDASNSDGSIGMRFVSGSSTKVVPTSGTGFANSASMMDDNDFRFMICNSGSRTAHFNGITLGTCRSPSYTPDYSSLEANWSQWPYNQFVITGGTAWNEGSERSGTRWENREYALNIISQIVKNKHGIETIPILFPTSETNPSNSQAYKHASSTGAFYDVAQGDTVDSALGKIFESVTTVTTTANAATSYSAINPALMQDNSANLSVNKVAAVSLDLANGKSEIQFYKVNNNTDIDTSAYTTPDMNASGRDILVRYNGTVYSSADGFSPDKDFFGVADNAAATKLWNWLKRSGSNDSSLRNEVPMGDILDTPLVAAGPDLYGQQKYLVTAANDGMVYMFQSNGTSAPYYKLMLNYIPADAQRESSSDLMRHHFKEIAAKGYVTDADKPHRYMVNGGLVVRTTAKGSSDTSNASKYQQIFMAGNLGQGGHGTYALNVGGYAYSNGSKKVGLDSSNKKADVPLFEKTDLSGYTIGSPQIGRVAVDTTLSDNDRLNKVEYAVFVGSGLTNKDGTGGKTALHIYHALNNTNVGLSTEAAHNSTATAGAEIKTIEVAGDDSGLMQPTLVDTDFDGTIDIAYALSYKGMLYRFDLRDRNPANWTAHKLFATKNGQRVTAAPAVMRINKEKYSVIFGTGSELFESDLVETGADTQTVYGILDDFSAGTGTAEVLHSDLLQQTITDKSFTNAAGETVQGREVSDNPMQATHKGWYFDLPAQTGCTTTTTSGTTVKNCDFSERVVMKPSMLLDTVVLSTRKYKNTTTTTTANPAQCVSETNTTKTSASEGWILQVKGDTGGKIPTKPDLTSPEWLSLTPEQKAAKLKQYNKDYGRYAYLDFLGKNTSKGNGLEQRPDEIVSGYHQPGLATFTLLVNAGSSLGLDTRSSYTLDGDAGGTGEDIPLKKGGRTVTDDSDRCFNNSTTLENIGFISNTNGGTGTTAYGVFGRVCEPKSNGGKSGTVRRLSWREIF